MGGVKYSTIIKNMKLTTFLETKDAVIRYYTPQQPEIQRQIDQKSKQTRL